MNALFALVWRLSGFIHPEWELQVGAGPAAEGVESGPTGISLENCTLHSLPHEQNAPRRYARLLRCSLDSASVENTSVGRMDACRATGSRWKGVEVDRVVLCNLAHSRLDSVVIRDVVASSMREANIEDGVLENLDLVDLSRARLVSVRMGRAVAVDFTGAVLERCDLSGVDLRGAVLRNVRFVDSDPGLALVAGADFRGARGFDRATRRKLLEAGARFRAAYWLRLMGNVFPSADPVKLERLTLVLHYVLLVFSALLCLLALRSVVWPPPAPPVPETPSALLRQATAMEVERTQQNLARLREAIASAHENMLRNGGSKSSWPTLADVQQGMYDQDGDGPAEARAELLAGGLPDNFLTDSVGVVLPYCNQVPSQGTLSGVDADWHYCEETGRVMASAG